jgi:transcriptional regulator with PAS, ATPase and Fis domain
MGTLFLDEVGELSQHAQVKLLRFIQDRTFIRIGETTNRSVNVRIIAASNSNLLQLVKDGAFREDLYYRLNVFNISLPPLRERKETIPNLIRLFVQRNNKLLNKNIVSISKAAEVIFAEYNYPGNIRELENIIEHAMVLAESNQITEKDLPEFMFGKRLMLTAPESDSAFSKVLESKNVATLAEVEKKHINEVLKVFNNNYQDTAKSLGISRSTLWRKIKAYNLEKG